MSIFQHIVTHDIAGDMAKLWLVLDTDVLVAALRSPSGASAALLRAMAARRWTPVVSVPLILEYESVLLRAEQLQAAGLEAAEVQSVIDVIVDCAHWTRVSFRYRPLTRDPCDEMVIEAALNAGASAIVTFNRRDFGTAPEMFNLGCWLPNEALKRIGDE